MVFSIDPYTCLLYTSNYVKAYAELYDEIVKGYENGTREIYVAAENGPRKLTKDEELSNLDAAYKKTVDEDVYKRQHFSSFQLLFNILTQ